MSEKNRKEPKFERSYESDGEMSKKKIDKSKARKPNAQDESLFFNITESSE
ncbi:hypothetical protein NC797_09140 [Aquibacillus sp. 3ASR75-11]|uniref:Uncharacterized protein n=1 Tax=Terrihalobacillus insolitus TaxID=2950438 RepID=A0A9X4ANM2_9BACI|nr:hypothetical protein [Terrihalobacillus insolitus]MDC3413570.1 hypothetical protein [Terrihalobacillus insolitus]MDC3424673.1 hypothetical protein [Terrihalobacillus insolitus]